MSQRILVLPEYNEANTVVGVLREAEPHVDRIIVINDGSVDNSGALLAEWAQPRPHVTILTLPQNQGKAGAMLCGFAYIYALLRQGVVSPQDLVITMDSDGQHRPHEIPLACNWLESGGHGVVLGRRTLQGYPWFKHLGNWGLSLWASMLTGYRYRDVECGFRVMRAEVLRDLLAYFLGRRYSCEQEIAIITAVRGHKVDNSFPAGIEYYRKGTRVHDGITNLVMGLRMALRVRLERPFDPDRRALKVLALVSGEVTEHFRALEVLAQMETEVTGKTALHEAGD